MKKECLKELVEGLAFCALLAGLVAMWLYATPNQMSAEYDWIVEQGKEMRNDR